MENQEVPTQKIAEARTTIILPSPSYEYKPKDGLFHTFK
jgi:hypothetical protein